MGGGMGSGFTTNGGPGNFRTTFNFNFDNFDARNVFKDFFGGKDPFENFGKFGFDFENDDMFKSNFKDPFADDDFFKGMGTSGFMGFNNMGGARQNMNMNFGGTGPGMNMNFSSSSSGAPSRNTGAGGGKRTSVKKTTQTV